MEPEGKITMTESTVIPWRSQTNWTIAAGSLENCVTFESSLSSTDDGDGEVEASTVDSSPESPLVLYPPSSDSGPCEIKINFAQKHEVRQVYVRSTARVYEIYSESNPQIGNEYLCTVRCGIAARDGQVLHAPDVEEIVSLHQRGSKRGLAEESIKTEEDWVEVKVSDTPVLDGGNVSLPTKSYINSAKSSQDLFEATAEITDANPCISVILRLLSIQSKGCIWVDEIYVFADPVALDDSESEEIHKGNSSSSSLMAMFLPTLMQLSKTTGLSRIDHNYCSVSKKKEDFLEVDLQETRPSDSVIKAQPVGSGSITVPQEVKLQEVNQGSVSLSQSEIPSQVAPMESNPSNKAPQIATTKRNCSDITLQAVTMENNHSDLLPQVATRESSNCGSLGVNVGRALEQLVSRMDRMQEICLGFQEKMLTPMSSIEVRLQRVEQQLEILTKKLQNFALPSPSSISAPDASCVESNINSCDNCHGCSVTEGIESDKKDFHTEVQSVPPDGMAESANSTQLLPGLVVTAPEFVDGEDEENNGLVSETNSSDDKQRNALSIDDALASAFAGFVSSISVQSPKYTRSLSFKAPEFSNEEDDHENSNATPRTLHVIEKNNSGLLKDSEGIDCVQESTSFDISLESGEKVKTDPNVKHSEETAKEAEEHGQICSGERDHSEVGVKATIAAEHVSRTGFNCILEEDESRETSLFLNESDIPNELLENQTGCNSGCNITQGGISANSDLTVATEVPERACHEDIVKNILGIAGASAAVNFEIPILDVEFISRNIADTKLLLEALLFDTQETNSLDPSVKESSDDLPIEEQLKSTDDLSAQEHYNLVSVDDGNLVNPATNSHYSVDNDYYYTLIDVPVHFEGDNLPGDHKRKNDETFSSSHV